MSSDTTRIFHLGDILTVTTGRLVSPRHIGGLYDILGFMTGDVLFTHQLIRAADECREPLLAQHPDLRDIDVPRDLDSEEKVMAWLSAQAAVYGETREIAPLAAGDHTRIDPLTEPRKMRPDAGIVTAIMPDGPEVTA